jgi:hypothetical protein
MNERHPYHYSDCHRESVFDDYDQSDSINRREARLRESREIKTDQDLKEVLSFPLIIAHSQQAAMSS